LEVEGPEEVASGIGEWNGSGPGDKFGWVRGSDGREELDGAEFHNVVDGVDREAIPLWPPAAPRVAEGFIRRVLKEELDMVDAGSSRVDTVGVGSGQGGVDTNEVPAGTSSAGRKIRDEKQFVGAGS
jgi:hypothetical protein